MALTLEMYVSEPILTEYTEVLKRPKFGFSADIFDQLMAEIRSRATLISGVPESCRTDQGAAWGTSQTALAG